MQIEKFIKILGKDFYVGVPDSQLKPLCDYLMNTWGIDPKHHVITANEGNSTALAAGYYLATDKIPIVYMQNSGEGNMINPAASLLSHQVYSIPIIFIIGWRGEPGVSDEPQHIFQGSITLKLLEVMDINYFILGEETREEDLIKAMLKFQGALNSGKSVALVVRKNSLTYDKQITYKNNYHLTREEAIQHIIQASGSSPIISTTGKASRELYENRSANYQNHKYDFLTVGGMGHSSSIALGIALHKPNTKIWCVDGDGAVLMHMGAMAVIGQNKPHNLIHIIINNGSHESVGGMPTAGTVIDFALIAKGCGYPYAVCVETLQDLDKELFLTQSRNELCLIEVKSSIKARKNLGRPTSTALENKNSFMDYLKSLSD